MKNLKDLLYRVPLQQVAGTRDRQVQALQFDSRHVAPGTVFIAIRGTQADGHQYIPAAEAQGAVAIVCEQLPAQLNENITYVQVRDAAESLAWMAANYHDNPAEEVACIGVTGTNGKSTVATLLYDLCTRMGYACGLIGTVEVRIAGQVLPATHTTPDPLQLQAYLAQMRDQGCAFCFMEVSSHALHQRRVVGIPFAGGLFTNLTRDHLDYHGSMAEYRNAKKLLFDQLPASAFALLNVDDKNGRFMAQNTRARQRTYALKSPADYQVRILESTFEGQLLEINGQEIWIRLLGTFNAYNLLAVVAAARELQLPEAEVLLHASELLPINGRFQTLHFGPITAIVDYAHTPDALHNSLKTLKEIQIPGRLIVLIGAGGNRDKGKRPEMARIACELADQVILTSDNPRDEDPAAILDDMEAGVPATARRRVLRLMDRREAIRTASQLAKPGDVILLAGKGHETYQEIRGVRHPFDDREELKKAFQSAN
jgi:UDP-N-acetylmuramoyl-L-alanyl-D-glutamate--2,6-diaminopimelate ligase